MSDDSILSFKRGLQYLEMKLSSSSVGRIGKNIIVIRMTLAETPKVAMITGGGES